jgi:hypothetical protein
MSGPVVILIFTHKADLACHEKISLQQCCRVLGKHPIRLVCPEGLDLAAYRAIVPEIQTDFIPRHWLASLHAYNRLKILPWLYRRYVGFEYILTYELDAFVFRDELLDWCAKGWDYIGAPWFEGYHLAMPDARPCGVGNSGFSLRRTQAMLRVSRTWRSWKPASEVMQEWRQGKRSLKGALAAMAFRDNFYGPLNNYQGQEDFFWCLLATRRFPWFRLAPHEAACKFSFEVNPSRLFRECGDRLPFGCHKWMSLEQEFWKRHIQSFGYKLSGRSVTG